MNNDIRKTTIITTIVCLLPVIAGIVLYNRLPDTLVTHWDSNGNPNGWESKMVGAIVFPGILVIVNLLFPLLLKVDPKYNNINGKVKALLHWIIPIVSIFCSASTLAVGLGYDSKVEITTPLFVGLIFVIIGNYLPKTKQTYTVGIKLPWTLASEDNWNKTHRLAGFLWVVCGILFMIGTFLPYKQYILIGLAIIMILVPTCYSFLQYRRSTK